MLTLLLVSGLVGLAGLRVWQWTIDPRFCLLTHESGARWIRANEPFLLSVRFNAKPVETHFVYELSLSESVSGGIVRVRAYRQFRLWLDSPDSQADPLFEHILTEGMSWKDPVDVRLPALSSGQHRLLIAVTNQGGPPCLLLSSPELGIFSGRHWKTPGFPRGWLDAADVDDPPVNVRQQVQNEGYPTSPTAFRHVWPWLLAVFGISFAWTWRSSRGTGSAPWWIPDRLSAAAVRWILLGAWWLMSTNNIWSVSTLIGFNYRDHLGYVRYLIEHQRVPLASDGLQMFQSPLQYLLAAPVYALASTFLNADECAKLLRIFPLLCGLAQIEIVFRSARLVFPSDNDRQVVALLIGGMMPMNVYMPQTFCNEPLAACLTGLVILQCLSLLRSTGELQGFWSFSRLGIIWGLALLAKVTPILLAPLIVLAVVYHGVKRQASFRWYVIALAAMLGTCLIVCGWYYGRNWVYLGSPFVGGADPSRGIVWSQHPGYRTWHQLTTFGDAMVQPIFAVAFGFWDGMYASMWCDGQMSATLLPADQTPWNVNFLQVGPWLAIVPMGCMLLGLFACCRSQPSETRVQILFSAAAIGIYLAAILDQYVGIPFYGPAKATYALGLLPCFSVLGAAGVGVFLRNRLLRALLFGALASYAFASYCAFFSLK